MKGQKVNTSYDDFDNPYVRVAYLCKICGKEQSRKFKFDWKRHYLTHGTEPKNFICKICGKAYNRQGPLNKHMKSHDNYQQQTTTESILMDPFAPDETKPFKVDYVD